MRLCLSAFFPFRTWATLPRLLRPPAPHPCPLSTDSTDTSPSSASHSGHVHVWNAEVPRRRTRHLYVSVHDHDFRTDMTSTQITCSGPRSTSCRPRASLVPESLPGLCHRPTNLVSGNETPEELYRYESILILNHRFLNSTPSMEGTAHRPPSLELAKL